MRSFSDEFRTGTFEILANKATKYLAIGQRKIPGIVLRSADCVITYHIVCHNN